MFKKTTIVLLFILIIQEITAQKEVTIQSSNLKLFGTLLEPKEKTDIVVLIITGSGETDRNGNNAKAGYTNNSLKLLAEKLSENNIASLRYDKRGVGKSINDSITAEKLRFEHYVSDAENWIKYLKSKYSKIIVAGHSQGFLVALKAIQNQSVEKLISIAGMSDNTYNTVKKQLLSQPEFVINDAFPILDSLQKGVKVDKVPKYLNNLFNPKIQNYFISLLKFDPQKEIQKIHIPILIVLGDSDLQISLESTKKMVSKGKDARLITISNMNHVLKTSTLNVQENMLTYSNPTLELHKELIPYLVNFIFE